MRGNRPGLNHGGNIEGLSDDLQRRGVQNCSFCVYIQPLLRTHRNDRKGVHDATQNAEHDARLVLRLPLAMLEALKWTSKVDKLPLSDWVRNILQEHCYSLSAYGNEETEKLIEGDWRRDVVVATRPATGLAERGDKDHWSGRASLSWKGGRKDPKKTLRSYTGLTGEHHLGSLPADLDFDKDRQDMILDRREARRELTTWLNRWGREGKTLRMNGKELRLVQRLLASFDEFDKDIEP